MAVSYTHLDVYKRQVKDYPFLTQAQVIAVNNRQIVWRVDPAQHAQFAALGCTRDTETGYGVALSLIHI